jgi:hypothetical protein
VKKLAMAVALAALALVVLVVLVPGRSEAQQKCEGPAELCAQIIELQVKLEEQKMASVQDGVEKTVEDQAKERKEAEDGAKAVGLAALIAVLLKAVLSALKGWRSFFTTDKGKAWLKVITVLIGFGAFFLTNVGMGIRWWQALIVAGGGPGAILVHEMLKLIPVIAGKKPLPEDERNPDSEPDTDPGSSPESDPAPSSQKPEEPQDPPQAA